jgi:hypothetical protein
MKYKKERKKETSSAKRADFVVVPALTIALIYNLFSCFKL